MFNYLRMDLNTVIKVADFGLTEDIYTKNYFRQGKDSSVKLPMKWMAPESLNDCIFTEASDVVSCLSQSIVNSLPSSFSHFCSISFHSRSVPSFLSSPVVIWCDMLGGVHWRS